MLTICLRFLPVSCSVNFFHQFYKLIPAGNNIFTETYLYSLSKPDQYPLPLKYASLTVFDNDLAQPCHVQTRRDELGFPRKTTELLDTWLGNFLAPALKNLHIQQQ
jgi:hypothetical protein